MQSVYSAAPAELAQNLLKFIVKNWSPCLGWGEREIDRDRYRGRERRRKRKGKRSKLSINEDWKTIVKNNSNIIYIDKYNSSQKFNVSRFSLVWFYGISTLVCYIMPNPLYTWISNIYDLVWFGLMV